MGICHHFHIKKPFTPWGSFDTSHSWHPCSCCHAKWVLWSPKNMSNEIFCKAAGVHVWMNNSFILAMTMKTVGFVEKELKNCTPQQHMKRPLRRNKMTTPPLVIRTGVDGTSFLDLSSQTANLLSESSSTTSSLKWKTNTSSLTEVESAAALQLEEVFVLVDSQLMKSLADLLALKAPPKPRQKTTQCTSFQLHECHANR